MTKYITLKLTEDQQITIQNMVHDEVRSLGSKSLKLPYLKRLEKILEKSKTV
jgi:hypothetical protein